MQPCLNGPTETEERRYYLQWEFTSGPTSNPCLILSLYHTITTQLSYVTTERQNQITRHTSCFSSALADASPLCKGLTHPTTLSFGTLRIHLPALANLASVLSFLFLFICDSSPPSKSNLLQMKSLQIASFNPNFPGYQRKSYHLSVSSFMLTKQGSYDFTQLTNFPGLRYESYLCFSLNRFHFGSFYQHSLQYL